MTVKYWPKLPRKVSVLVTWKVSQFVNARHKILVILGLWPHTRPFFYGVLLQLVDSVLTFVSHNYNLLFVRRGRCKYCYDCSYLIISTSVVHILFQRLYLYGVHLLQLNSYSTRYFCSLTHSHTECTLLMYLPNVLPFFFFMIFEGGSYGLYLKLYLLLLGPFFWGVIGVVVVVFAPGRLLSDIIFSCRVMRLIRIPNNASWLINLPRAPKRSHYHIHIFQHSRSHSNFIQSRSESTKA